MEILYVLLILLVATRFFGEASERLKQPALLGELVAGIVLGLVVARFSGAFPVLAGLADNEVFKALTDLGIFFLMLLAGVEMHPREIAESSGRAGAAAVGGMLLPLGLGIGLGLLVLPASDYRFAQSLFLGTALAITAVPVTVKVLMDINWLDSDVGRTIVSAALFDDVLSLILLAVLTAFIREGEPPTAVELVWLVGRVGLFFAITVPLGWYVFPLVGRWLKAARASEFELSMLLVAALGYSLLAEALHMHFIMGAFVAGVFFGRRTVDERVYERVEKQVSGVTTGFLAPIFFASIGLHLDLSAVTSVPVFLLVLIGLAFFGKLAGSAIPARMAGMSWRKSWAVGCGMSGRGAVELIIAGVALEAGLFEHPDPPGSIVGSLFSSIVIMAVVTTALTPVLLRVLLGGKRETDGEK